MNEDIIRMAREKFIARGFWPNEVMWACWRDAWLAASAIEREACAEVCETEGIGTKYQGDVYAAAIRARSNK